MLVTEMLERQKNNSKIAITYSGKGITYNEWFNQATKLSAIIDFKIGIDSKCVGIFLPNSIDYAISYFGILFSNRVVVPISIQSKGLDIKSTLEYCEIDLIITNSEHKHNLINYISGYKKQIIVLCIDTREFHVINSQKNFISKSGLPKNIGRKDDVAIMLHTSGTTSNPKRVMLTHDNLVSNVKSNIASLDLTPHDKVLITLPMFFGYCNTAQFLTHVYLGASMVIMDGIFLPKMFFQTVQNEGITNFTSVPSLLLALLEYRYYYKYDISQLRYICFGGGAMPVEKLRELIKKFDSVGFVQTFGQTEASPRVTALLPSDSLKKLGSVGKPIPGVQVRVVDNNDLKQAVGGIGEVIVRGNNVMKGYFKQDKITGETLKNGWLYTGDLGYFDEDGFLYLTGRKKNMIISGGVNIYPEEIEEILILHPNVSEVCVMGEAHHLLGEVPIAKVVLKRNEEINLRDFCLERLAQYKVPSRFFYVNELPKTYNGKIKRC